MRPVSKLITKSSTFPRSSPAKLWTWVPFMAAVDTTRDIDAGGVGATAFWELVNICTPIRVLPCDGDSRIRRGQRRCTYFELPASRRLRKQSPDQNEKRHEAWLARFQAHIGFRAAGTIGRT